MPDYPFTPVHYRIGRFVVVLLGILSTAVAIAGFMALLILYTPAAILAAAVFVTAAVARWLARRAR